MAAGGPGLSGAFVQRGQTFTVTAVLRTWRDTGRCHHGSPERYLRRHWYDEATGSHGTLKLYFDRQARGGRKAMRMWLYNLCTDRAPVTT